MLRGVSDVKKQREVDAAEHVERLMREAKDEAEAAVTDPTDEE